jgi:hypothetical protein
MLKHAFHRHLRRHAARVLIVALFASTACDEDERGSAASSARLAPLDSGDPSDPFPDIDPAQPPGPLPALTDEQLSFADQIDACDPDFAEELAIYQSAIESGIEVPGPVPWPDPCEDTSGAGEEPDDAARGLGLGCWRAYQARLTTLGHIWCATFITHCFAAACMG